MTAQVRRGLVFITCGLPLLTQAPQQAQDLSHAYAALTPIPAARMANSVPLRQCGTSFGLLRHTSHGFTAVGPLTDGRPLRADQTPRFLRPDHDGEFGFTDFLVLGDHETVTFERTAPELTESGEDLENTTTETWQRTGTQEVSGRLVSVFNPRWTIDILHDVLRVVRWGVDKPFLFWGKLVVPGGGTGAAPGGVAPVPEDTGAGRINVYLNIVPPNIPSSEVTQIGETIQYSSHAVNIWDPDFGDSRVTGGDVDLNLTEITQTFYEHFEDRYDIIAVVSQAAQIAEYTGFHANVRNEIAGIGLDLFDDSAQYGSAGVLQGIEGYPPGGWASWPTVLHQTAHQWNEYTNTWDQVGPPAASVRSAIDRQGRAPDVHTPLLFPGEVLAGAVLEATRRVAEQGGSYSIEASLPLITFNPLTLYRMGHTSGANLPTYQVFFDQDPFEKEPRRSPDVGTAVNGARVEVSVNDMMAADGGRSGPTITRLRRALVYVSRAGLVSKAEMDVVNYFGKRLGENSGVTSWDRYPSFSEATGGLATMTTDINPTPESIRAPGVIQQATKIVPGPAVRCASVATTALIGFTLDNEIPGCIGVGDQMTLSGTLNLTDRNDYHVVCFGFRRYRSPAPTTINCTALTGNRFSLDVSSFFTETGTYMVEAYAFFPDSGTQSPRSRYTSIEVR